MQATNYVSAQLLNLYRTYLVCHMTVDSHREASLSCARNPPGLHLPPIRARSGSTEEICSKKRQIKTMRKNRIHKKRYG